MMYLGTWYALVRFFYDSINAMIDFLSLRWAHLIGIADIRGKHGCTDANKVLGLSTHNYLRQRDCNYHLVIWQNHGESPN